MRLYDRALTDNEVKANYNYDNKNFLINNDYFENLPKENNNIKIASLTEFANFRDEVNRGNTFEGKYVELTNDIDFASINSWQPVGNSTTSFKGVFNGNNHNITNLTIDNNTDTQGLFYKNEGVIENLNIKSGTIKGTYKVGAIAGINAGVIIGCNNEAVIQATRYHVGGICGYNTGNIEYCINDSNTITSNETSIAGIVGRSDLGLIKFCGNNGSIRPSGSAVGGIAGSIKGGIVSSCYNKGNIEATGHSATYHSSVAGIVGSCGNGGDATIKWCYNTGNITASWSNAAGITGVLQGNVIYCYNTGTITAKAGNENGNTYAGGIAFNVTEPGATVKYCYNTGSVVAVSGTKYPGGIAGYIVSGTTVSNSYTLSSKISTIVANNKGTVSKNEALTEANMKTAAFVTKLGGTYYWRLDGDYPKLNWQ